MAPMHGTYSTITHRRHFIPGPTKTCYDQQTAKNLANCIVAPTWGGVLCTNDLCMISRIIRWLGGESPAPCYTNARGGPGDSDTPDHSVLSEHDL